jgi:hypothetical protein
MTLGASSGEFRITSESGRRNTSPSQSLLHLYTVFLVHSTLQQKNMGAIAHSSIIAGALKLGPLLEGKHDVSGAVQLADPLVVAVR